MAAYFSSRDIRRSASGLPPVWQVGQYCRLGVGEADLAHGVAADRARLAGAAVHREVGLLLALELAGGQAAGALDGVAELVLDRGEQPVCSSSAVRLLAGLNGDILAACRISSE